MRFNP